MRSRAVWLMMVAVLSLLGAPEAFAQIGQGRLAGIVTDTQGRMVVTNANQLAIERKERIRISALGSNIFPQQQADG